ncbi:hypothetical protein ONZ45_g6607 [Pleurotus djamor]|nr:hypothetical protein ONZ45_g6607 [Pleurotus djamor]
MTAQEQSASQNTEKTHDKTPQEHPPNVPDTTTTPAEQPVTSHVNGIHQPEETSTTATLTSSDKAEASQVLSGTLAGSSPKLSPDNLQQAPEVSAPESTQRREEEQSSSEKKENGTALNGASNSLATPNKVASADQPTNGIQPAASSKKSTKPPSQHKPSFLVKLVLKLVPCVGPSKAHDTQTEEPVQQSSNTTEEKATKVNNTTSSNDPPATPPKDSQNEKEAVTSTSTSEPAGPSKTIPPPISVTPPPASDSDILIPPTPTTQLLPEEETGGVTAGAVQAPGSTGHSAVTVHHEHKKRDSMVVSNGTGDGEESDATTFETDEEYEEPRNEEVDDEEDSLILRGGAGIPIGPDGVPKPLLPPIAPQHVGRKCLVLDLDETLVHSSFKSIQQADYVVPVEIEYHWHNVYVIKRPGVDNFLKKMGEIYEVVVFTASLSKYADPVLDKLDIHQVVSHRLFRESCYNHKGNYVKDLSQLGRPIGDTIILDNSPASYIFHPNNAVPVSSWFNDPHDTELTDLVPFLTDLSAVDDVRGVLDGAR